MIDLCHEGVSIGKCRSLRSEIQICENPCLFHLLCLKAVIIKCGYRMRKMSKSVVRKILLKYIFNISTKESEESSMITLAPRSLYLIAGAQKYKGF